MHGLINRSIEIFLKERHGAELWQAVAQEAQVPDGSFEAMLRYEDGVTARVLAAAASRLSRSEAELLEDLGIFLVTSERTRVVRRLLRYGGVSYREFLYSLDDLRDRVWLAVPELEMPRFELQREGETGFHLICESPVPGMGHVTVGVLRALADDYGALVLLDESHGEDGRSDITVHLLNSTHAAGRRFSLAGEPA
ncbi:Heme NO binding protein [Pseudoruegeria aquimaris]|uniref:Heme NO binding protein n=1 Tax=Pseudoruegeria aquimaris TaxID=393663 RepID=A0A1Y5T9F7_9RHOB|nr:heme NO-binding domain-containing protein [Pseudoruegeria aquimaris]SLN56986.1 Heme NO binding protein [Pseudoruegeria aquimaris]